MVKKVRRNQSDLGADFIAPDGGNWSWLICIAGGLSNVRSFTLNTFII